MHPWLSYANVMSTAAAFLALAGGTTAVALSGKNSVKKDDIAKNAVRAKHVANNAIDSADLKNESVTGADIGTGAVGSAELLGGSVGSAALAAAAVGTAHQAAVPAARVGTSGPTAAPNNVLVPVDLGSDTGGLRFDPFDMWDPSDPRHLYPPVDGIYLVTAEVHWPFDDTAAPGGQGDHGDRHIRLVGNGIFGRDVIAPVRFDGGDTFHRATAIVDLDAGDPVAVHLAQRNEDSSEIEAISAELQMIWLSPGV